jgi:lipopolysaccharide/colanic/teichoic acid biosynthesis glycosyltransferase
VTKIRVRPFALAAGDLAAVAAALYLALAARAWTWPSWGDYLRHLEPFAVLSVVWLGVFFVAGLYDSRAALRRRSEPRVLLYAQVANSLFAVAFFYFIPYFGIAPKTILALFLGASFGLLLVWRAAYRRLVARRAAEGVVLVGRGEEMRELRDAINRGGLGYQVVHSVSLDAAPSLDVQADVVRPIYEQGATTVIVDTHDDAVSPLLPHLYNLMFAGISFVSLHEVYEEIFGRVPLSLVSHGWFLENVRTKPHALYDAAKRVFDTLLAVPILAVALALAPLVWAARRAEGRVPLLSFQDRVGQGGRMVRFVKFATMLFNDNGTWRADGAQNRVTRVGAFLRRTRIDELPQAWNVLRGEVSLIGPRPEFPAAVKTYSEQIPYYGVRHLIKPGLSGWAQMYGEHAHHGVDVEATRNKLSYDLFYVKNRSFWLDMAVAARTVRSFLLREGR